MNDARVTGDPKRAADPAVAAAAELTQLLAARNISVTKAASQGAAPRVPRCSARCSRHR